ncbi:hypothetical protein Tco_0156907 [Tanacetum coccineum]
MRISPGFGGIAVVVLGDHVNPIIRLPIERGISRVERVNNICRRDTSPAPLHNIYSFYESESSESESEDVREIDIKTLTLEQYLALNLNNTRRRISNPEDATFEIKGQFLRELRKTTFSGSSTENAIEHIEKVLEVASLFNANDSALLRVFSLTLVGIAKRWFDRTSLEHAKNWEELKQIFI